MPIRYSRKSHWLKLLTLTQKAMLPWVLYKNFDFFCFHFNDNLKHLMWAYSRSFGWPPYYNQVPTFACVFTIAWEPSGGHVMIKFHIIRIGGDEILCIWTWNSSFSEVINTQNEKNFNCAFLFLYYFVTLAIWRVLLSISAH